jgi:hypothetical protein
MCQITLSKNTEKGKKKNMYKKNLKKEEEKKLQ